MDFEDQEEQEEEMEFEEHSRAKMEVETESQQHQQQQQHQHVLTGIRKPVRYRECLKNHAVGIGGHAVDGCGEFMAAGDEGTLDALKCAACNCHRNFHRKETETPTALLPPPLGAEVYFHQPPHQFAPYYRTPAGYLHVAHRPLALPSTSGGGGGSREGQEEDLSDQGAATPPPSGAGSSRKRFRTKFTVEQKDKMLALAERLGWRIQKHDEEAVQEFCNETGVKRHVLKVWMHNNKHTLGKKP